MFNYYFIHRALLLNFFIKHLSIWRIVVHINSSNTLSFVLKQIYFFYSLLIRIQNRVDFLTFLQMHNLPRRLFLSKFHQKHPEPHYPNQRHHQRQYTHNDETVRVHLNILDYVLEAIVIWYAHICVVKQKMGGGKTRAEGTAVVLAFDEGEGFYYGVVELEFCGFEVEGTAGRIRVLSDVCQDGQRLVSN